MKNKFSYTSQWFISFLGGIFLIAFFSLWGQIEGLVGSQGLLPVGEFLEQIRAYYGGTEFFKYPTLSWFNESDSWLMWQGGIGVFTSLMVIFRLFPSISLFLAWLFYLSLVTAGQTFFSFQWDALLLEVGFAGLFLCPFNLKIRSWIQLSEFSKWLLWIILFKLMFLSGVVKLMSGDESWLNLTALDYHYFTQPLPNAISWYADKWPDWFQKLSVAIMLFIELVVPFFILIGGMMRYRKNLVKWGRKLHLIAFFAFSFLMLIISLTGNYNFFNLLTIVLSFFLLDDFHLKKWNSWFSKILFSKFNCSIPKWRRIISNSLIGILLFFSLIQFWRTFTSYQDLPSFTQGIIRTIQPFRSVNSYGLFRVMTKERPEILIQGSFDGEDWYAYEFKYKPGELIRRPAFAAPHQPRLDWQMWFAALGSFEDNPWVIKLMQELMNQNPVVNDLIADNPFKDDPPNYMRALVFNYKLSSKKTLRETGQWWVRELKGAYTPRLSRRLSSE